MNLEWIRAIEVQEACDNFEHPYPTPTAPTLTLGQQIDRLKESIRQDEAAMFDAEGFWTGRAPKADEKGRLNLDRIFASVWALKKARENQPPQPNYDIVYVGSPADCEKFMKGWRKMVKKYLRRLKRQSKSSKLSPKSQ